MKLNEWLFKLGISKTEIARKLGYSRTHIQMIISGKRRPSKKLSQKIVNLTKQVVSSTEISGRK